MILVFSLAAAVTFTILVIGEVMRARRPAVRNRLAEIESIGSDLDDPIGRRRRLIQSERLIAILEALGARMSPDAANGAGNDIAMLTHAGYRRQGAVAIYWGVRLAAALSGLAFGLVVLPVSGVNPRIALFIGVYLATLGFLLPLLLIRARVRSRQKNLRNALPDALDLLVVCVEAGLGLNQAMVRVAQEIRHSSRLMSDELLQTNAEIRVGTPRDQALRTLADRTGLDDLSSLVSMLIQTDRFGTSIATSLRVHSDTLRQKRRQRAEEAAAKTAIKMVFPLVFCIFPAMFVVILAPGFIQILRALSGIA
ncbi:MAG: type II secretion system F family protein [Longimicrobiales bacterium]